MRQRREVANLIRISNRKTNCFRWSETETDAHINTKFLICRALKKLGREFYSEAIFNNGLRADVIDADQGMIYEVVESEKEESIAKKRKDYPLDIIVVQAGKFEEAIL